MVIKHVLWISRDSMSIQYRTDHMCRMLDGISEFLYPPCGRVNGNIIKLDSFQQAMFDYQADNHDTLQSYTTKNILVYRTCLYAFEKRLSWRSNSCFAGHLQRFVWNQFVRQSLFNDWGNWEHGL